MPQDSQLNNLSKKRSQEENIVSSNKAIVETNKASDAL